MTEATVIEPAIELPTFPTGARAHGRLILTDAGLYFIHGWDEQDRRGLWWTFERDVLDEDTGTHAGQHLLAEVAGLPPAQQAQRVPSSRVFAFAELSSASLDRWRSRLIVETRRHGDTLIYRIPRARRGDAEAWVASYSGMIGSSPGR